MAGGEIGLDACDQRRGFHRRQQVSEEALLGGFEGRARGRFGLAVQRAALTRDVRRLHRGSKVVVDDGEGPGIGIVDTALLGRQRMLEHLVFDTVVGERAGGIEAKRPQVAGENLHRSDTPRLNGLHELGTGGEGE